MNDLQAFFAKIHFGNTSENPASHPLQIGSKLQFHFPTEEELKDADIIIIGCGERRASSSGATTWSDAPNAIRKKLYALYDWHPSVKVVDLGNLLEGESIRDSKKALEVVLAELNKLRKTVVLLGGSQDLTLQQYNVFKQEQQNIQVAVLDSKIDLEEMEGITDESYLMDMLTSQPNYVTHFNHIGFQSYFVNPKMLETLDKLRFDCYRLGRVRENLENIEPVFRTSDVVSVDLNVLRACDANFLHTPSPNGLFGDELCQLVRYAGMSAQTKSLGIYGYHVEKDEQEAGALLIAQMLWYFVDGFKVRKQETAVALNDHFMHYFLQVEGINFVFLKSKVSNRWWMARQGDVFYPCSYQDYLDAAAHEIPDRWLREQERLV